jgi:tetratricopeptide (TPR) repeat protein
LSTVLDSLLEQSDREPLYEFCKEKIQKNTPEFFQTLIPLYRTLMGNLADADLHHTIAQLYYDFGFYANALEACLDILDTQIDYIPSYVLLDKLYYQSQPPEPIIDQFETALKDGFWFPIIIDSLPKFYADHGTAADLVWFYEHWRQSTGSLSPYYMDAALAYQANHQYHPAAEAYYAYAKESDIARNHAIHGLKRLLRQHKHCGHSYQWLIQLLIQESEPDAIHAVLLQVRESDCPETMDACFRLATEHYPDHARFWVLWLTIYTHIPWNEEQYMHINQRLLSLTLCDTDTELWITTTQHTLSHHRIAIGHQVLLLDILFDHNHDHAAYTHLSTLLATDHVEPSPALHDLMHRIGTHENPVGLYLYAQWLIQTQQYALAQPTLDQLSETSYQAKALLLSSELAKQTRHYPAMVRILVDLIQRYPYTVAYHNALMDAHAYWGTEQRNRLTTQSPKTHYQLGLLAFRDERLSDAIAHFQKIRFISKPKPQQLIGRCFLEDGLYSLAMDTLASSYTESPNSQTLFWLVCAAIHAGDDAAAMRYHRQLMQTAIDTPGITELGHDVHQRQLHQSLPKLLGVALNWRNQSPHLIALPPVALITQKQRNYTNLNFSNHHNDTGISQSLHHNIRDANQSFELAIQLNNEHPVAHHNAAVTQSILTASPAPESGLTAACVHLIHRNFSEALPEWLALTQKKSVYYGLACLNTGDCYFQLNQAQKAYYYWQLARTTISLNHLVHQRFYHLNPKRMGFNSLFSTKKQMI